MEHNNNILETEQVSKLIFKFCLPSVIAMIITGVQSTVDGIFLGRFESSYAMASVNIAQPFMQLVIGVSMIICMGSISLCARKMGSGKMEESRDVFKTSFILSLLSTFIIFILGVFFNREVALFLGASETLLEGSREYIFGLALFSPFICLMFLLGFTNRLLNKPNLYVIGSVVALIVNIICDYIFIVKLQMGVLGAGFATGIAFTFGFLTVCKPLFSKSSVLNIFVGNVRKEFICEMLYNGSSEGVTALSTAVTVFLFNFILSEISGDNGVVAFTAINYISSFSMCILFGMADGSTPLISYNYGSNLIKRVKEILKIGVIFNFIIGVIIFILVYVGGEHIIGIFLKGDRELLNFTVDGSKMYSLHFILAGINILISSYFTALGKARQSVIIAASRGLIFVVLGMIILPKLFGLNGIWLTLFAAEVCTLIISYAFVKKYKIS